MKLEVTRDVVSDLWPLCRSGDASADSRALVDGYLATDPAFAAKLKESETLPGLTAPLRLSPDAERRLLDNARDHARRKLVVVGVAIGFGGVILLAALFGAMRLMGVFAN